MPRLALAFVRPDGASVADAALRAETSGDGVGVRAKALPRRAHASTVGPCTTIASPDSASVRMRSRRRALGREFDARTIDEACSAAGASHGDCAASWDLDKERAREVRGRAGGAQPAVEVHMGIENAPSDHACSVFLLLLVARARQCRPQAFEMFLAALLAAEAK